VWFIQGNTFSEWKMSETKSSLLWVHGKRPLIPNIQALAVTEIFVFVAGTGKTVLWYAKLLIFASRDLIVLTSSTIIEDIDAMRKAGLASLAFFYIDFSVAKKQDIRGLLSSFLFQLLGQSDSYYDVLFKFYSDHAEGSRLPSEDALAECLQQLFKLPGLAPVYLIVDALDVCPNTPAGRSPRTKVLNLMGELINHQFPNLRICITSRTETDIKDVLTPLAFRCISLDDHNGLDGDIEKYVESVVNRDPMVEAGDKERVIEFLKEKGDGR